MADSGVAAAATTRMTWPAAEEVNSSRNLSAAIRGLCSSDHFDVDIGQLVLENPGGVAQFLDNQLPKPLLEGRIPCVDPYFHPSLLVTLEADDPASDHPAQASPVDPQKRLVTEPWGVSGRHCRLHVRRSAAHRPRSPTRPRPGPNRAHARRWKTVPPVVTTSSTITTGPSGDFTDPEHRRPPGSLDAFA